MKLQNEQYKRASPTSYANPISWVLVGVIAMFGMAACSSNLTQAQASSVSSETTVAPKRGTQTAVAHTLTSSVDATIAATTADRSTNPTESAFTSRPSAEASSTAPPSTDRISPTSALSDVEVPAYCDMPAQKLHGGVTLAKYLPKTGGIDFEGAKPIAVQFSGIGSGILAQYSCSAGGNGAAWPEVILLYNDQGALVTYLLLSSYTSAEHAAVTSWTVSGDTVTVTWESFEGAGGQMTNHQSSLTYANDKLVWS